MQLYDPKPLVDCPVCAEKIKPGVAVCKSCNAILDRERAAQYGLIAEERDSPPRRRTGPEPKPETPPAANSTEPAAK